MPKYRYQAMTEAGVPVRGTIEAESFQAADDRLKSEGYWVLSLKDHQDSLLYREINIGSSRVKSDHFVLFCRQLATMVEAGINVMDALTNLTVQTGSKTLKRILKKCIDSMEQGSQFSEAARKHPQVFNSVFISMVRAGEETGNLSEMLERLAVLHEKEHYTKEKVTSALVYPAFMSVVSVVVIIIMMLYVVPNYVSSFQSMDMELPLPTKIVMGLSEWMQSYWLVLILALCLPVFILLFYYRTDRGRYLIDYAKLKVPIFGKLWHKQSISRFSRTFSTLFSASVSLQNILNITSDVVGNKAIGSVILAAREAVFSGHSMASAFKKSNLFPPMVVQMTAAGEASGTLQVMFEKVADFYENDVDSMADRLKALLEPILLFVMAGIVGVIVLAILLPTFQMMGNM